MECLFNNPVNFSGAPATAGEQFAFSAMTCVDDKFQQYTQAGTGSANFYLQKTISYGDVLTLIFFTFFLCAIIFKLLWNFVWKDYKAKL